MYSRSNIHGLSIVERDSDAISGLYTSRFKFRDNAVISMAVTSTGTTKATVNTLCVTRTRSVMTRMQISQPEGNSVRMRVAQTRWPRIV